MQMLLFFCDLSLKKIYQCLLGNMLKARCIKRKKKIDRNHLLNVIYFSRTDGFEHEEHETASES